MSEELDVGRRKARRKMAWISFSALLSMALAIMLGLFLGPAAFAVGVQTVSGVLNMILGAFVAIILGYLGASAYEAKNR